MNRLVYILAASHSGSTLLAMLLGAHPEACTIGELKLSGLGDLDLYRCGCGEPIIQCRFWSEVKEQMKKRGFEFNLNSAGTNIFDTDDARIRFLLRPLHRNPLMELCRDGALALASSWYGHEEMVRKRNFALVESLQEITGAKVIIDSSKVGIRLKYLLRDRNTDIRAIHLIRDGRGVALTYVDPVNFADAKDPSCRAGGFGGSRDNERHSIIEATTEWKRSNEEAEAVIATMAPEKCLEVRYDNLCKNPSATLKKICMFLEIDPKKIVLDFRSTKQHVVGNGMRLDKTSEIVYDERWREHLTQKQLEQFDKLAGKLNRKYGYV